MPTIVTLNTWKGDGDYAARLPLMAEGLAALDADVVCLQECFAAWPGSGADPAAGDGSLADTAAELARRLDLRLFHAPARWKPRVFRGAPRPSTSGLAVLTRLAAGPMEVLQLPSDPRDGERIAQGLEVRTARARLRIVNLHLTHLRDAAALRAEQLAAVLARWGGDGTATVLAGDFNATFDDVALAPLRSRDDLDVGPAPPAFWPGTLVDRPERAIDHVLLLRGDGAGLAIAARRPVLDRPDAAGVHPSDHAGVLVELAPA